MFTPNFWYLLQKQKYQKIKHANVRPHQKTPTVTQQQQQQQQNTIKRIKLTKLVCSGDRAADKETKFFSTEA